MMVLGPFCVSEQVKADKEIEDIFALLDEVPWPSELAKFCNPSNEVSLLTS